MQGCATEVWEEKMNMRSFKDTHCFFFCFWGGLELILFLPVTFKTLPTLSSSDTMLCKNARARNTDFGAAEVASPLSAEATDQSLLRATLMA